MKRFYSVTSEELKQYYINRANARKEEKNMAKKQRNFMEIYRKIKEIAPEELRTQLEKRAEYWAPEICWQKLTECVNRFVPPSSEDETSVAVYALLCDCSTDEMRERFMADGF